MIDLIPQPERDFRALIGEARDALNGLVRVGGPDFSYYSLAQKLQSVTPRFDWQENDVRGFIIHAECRFHLPAYKLRGPKEHKRDLMKLDDVLAIRSYAEGELEPLLKKIREAGTSLKIPTELIVSDDRNVLNFAFETAAAKELAFDRPFNFKALSALQRMAEEHLKKKKDETPSSSSAQPSEDPSP